VRIGIDLGGTKIEAIALASDGTVLDRRRVDTPQGDYQATLRAIVNLVDAVESHTRQRGSIGVATPGALSPFTGLLRNSNSVCLNNQPFDNDLSSALGRPIRIANDADCLALSEATDGAAAGAASVFGVIIGTGTGGGIVIHGRLLAGANAIAGEWGHNPLPWPHARELPGPPCYCGKHGCIETFLSGPGLSLAHQQRCGQSLSARAIAESAASGDAEAETSLQQYEHRLARALASVINILDPEVIVLGGGLSNITRLYANVPRIWGDYIFSDQVRTRMVPAMHGDSSGVRGAAWLNDG
jgi:predicted NBD/HSP70 family sugar kinase